MYTSLAFNEVVGLHVHNQQEYKLVVGAGTRCTPPPSPAATHSASRVGDRNMSMHAQTMPDEMWVAALAPLHTSSELVEAVAQLLQKQKVRVARHLQVRVEAHQMQLRAQHAKEWDERHAEHGMSQTPVAQSVEEDRLRSVALPASGKDALCVLMQTMSFSIAWDGNVPCMPWCCTLDRRGRRVALWCMSF